jgi:hypothetical protein
VTLQYLAPDESPGMAEFLTTRTGPVTLDRLRVAFGGVVTDFPLGSVASQTVAPEADIPVEVPESAPAAVAGVEAQTAAAGPIREVWDGPLN